MKRLACMLAIALATAVTTGGGAATGADVGATLAGRELVSIDGSKMRLSSLRGDVVVVNFWASWCGPCRKELALFESWSCEWNGRGARVVAISIDKDARKARRFAEDLQLTLTVLHDGPDGLARALDLPSVPCTFLLDHEGKVTRVVRSSNAEELAALKREVESMLAQRKVQAAGMDASATTPAHGDSR